MTNEQMHRFHDELRAKYDAESKEADRLRYEGDDEFLEGLARGRAGAYADAMVIFWNIANEVKP